MTKHSWLERLTPFTGGMAMALLIVALVVQPAWAVTPACAACMDYWTAHAADPGQPCYGKSGYDRSSCIGSKVSYECTKYKTTDSTGKVLYSEPCDGAPGDPGYTNCASEVCSLFIVCEMDELGNVTDSTTACYDSTGQCTGCNADGNSCNFFQRNPPPAKVTATPCLSYCGCGNPTTPNP